MKYFDIRLLCIALMFALLFMLVGCGAGFVEEEPTAEEKAAAEEIDARPVRLKIVSKSLEVGSYTFAVVIQDIKTGEEYIVVRERLGDAVAITPIKGR